MFTIVADVYAVSGVVDGLQSLDLQCLGDAAGSLDMFLCLPFPMIWWGKFVI